MKEFIDVHCHLTGDDYHSVGGAEEVLKRAKEQGVGLIICSGYDLDSSFEAAELAERHDGLYFCAGFHPGELHKYKDGDFERLKALCRHEKCVAVGEIGFDLHFESNPTKETQEEFFLRQMQIADELSLPIVVHSRDAAADTLRFLKENEGLLKRGGLMHCYSYSPEMLAEFLKLGFYFSFGGPSTFKNANKVYESVRRTPTDRLLSETDCPYLTPVPLRGTFPNEPKNVTYVAARLAELKETDLGILKEAVAKNAKRLFYKVK